MSIVDPELQCALDSFVAAFENLDMIRLLNYIAEYASMFHPRASGNRATGHEEIRKSFEPVFIRIRCDQTQPPFHRIQPRDLIWQLLGDTALATFYLDDQAGKLNRRTIVWNQTDSGWKIVHIHASEISLD